MKKHLLSYIWLLLTFLITGCSDNDENIPDTQPSFEISIETTPQTALPAEGGTATLTFTATNEWTARIDDADWLTVSPAQGNAGTVTLQINAQANNTYDERNAAVILTCGTNKETLTITQKQLDALILTSDKVEMDQNGGTFSIELQANVDITYEIAADAQTWITPTTSRGLTPSTLSFEVAENTEKEVRQGIITLQGNKLTEKVTVYQVGDGPAILLSQKEYLLRGICNPPYDYFVKKKR